MVIQSNIAAMFTGRQLNINTDNLRKSAERLSSGYRINRAADDAAGLTISEKMRWQIRGLNRASKNIQDGISFIQVAEGALNEEDSIVQRIRELSVQAANDTNTDSDRDAIQSEIDQLIEESDNIFKNTTFNTLHVWKDAYKARFTGTQLDMKFYNDSPGNQPDGIIWGDTRYSWDELGVNPYSGKGTHITDQVIDAVEYDAASDSYVPNGEKISLTFESVEDGTGKVVSVNRVIDMTADDDGVVMDGVLYTWDMVEDENHVKGNFDPDNVTGGTWAINTYNGYHVEFDVKEGDDIDDVIDGLNGDSLTYSTVRAVTSYAASSAVTATMGESYEINSSNLGYVGTYTLLADSNGLSVQLSNTLDPTVAGTYSYKSWVDLGVINSAGEWEPHHSTDLSSEESRYNEKSVRDDHDDISSHYAIGYKIPDEIGGGVIGIQILQGSNQQSVIDQLDGKTFTRTLEAPSKVTRNATSSLDSHIKSSSGSYSGGFTKQYNLGRDFDSATANLMSGTLGTNSSGHMVLNMTTAGTRRDGGNSNIAYTCSSSESSIKNSIKSYLNTIANSKYTTSETMSLTFSSGDDGSLSFSYTIGLTNDEKQQIKDGTLSTDDLANSIYGSIQNNLSSVTVSNNGMASQNVSYAERNRTEAIKTNVYTTMNYKRGLMVQTGALAGQAVSIDYRILSASVIGITGLDVSSFGNASEAISRCDSALDIINSERSLFGSYQNRLEHAKSVDDLTAENTQSAESKLRDADMADEMVAYSSHNILVSAAQAMLTQANKSRETVLSLLQ
jgi:flagellin-like hook-associated protein FlgL